MNLPWNMKISLLNKYDGLYYNIEIMMNLPMEHKIYHL